LDIVHLSLVFIKRLNTEGVPAMCLHGFCAARPGSVDTTSFTPLGYSCGSQAKSCTLPLQDHPTQHKKSVSLIPQQLFPILAGDDPSKLRGPTIEFTTGLRQGHKSIVQGIQGLSESSCHLQRPSTLW